MNEMYDMSIGLHDVGVLLYGVMMALNMLLLAAAAEIRVYAKRMRILMPVTATMIGVAMFTGMVMMAAKHLDFTVENLAMIVLSVVLIVIEVKRYKALKRCAPEDAESFTMYKRRAMTLMAGALGATVLLSGWMLLP